MTVRCGRGHCYLWSSYKGRSRGRTTSAGRGAISGAQLKLILDRAELRVCLSRLFTREVA